MEIETLVKAFDEKTLPKTAWTHEAHLTVALWYVSNYSIEEAICRVKSGIMSYNLSLANENTGVSGYHETLTIFWMDVAHEFRLKNANFDVLALINEFLNSENASKTFPFQFYSKEKILSPLARSRYILPDK
ncbi:MAG: hypothetical protein ACKVOU_09310 [Cytophagales bacterium]